ncbi:MAG TPA: hypothetical protein VLQ80_34795, partial [Candidatus Saccharimonadia bacterium]|nr:hypothetical protein [Candidatus Saccharimonadia bacterium]
MERIAARLQGANNDKLSAMDFAEYRECEIFSAFLAGITAFDRPILQENTPKCVLHLRRRNQPPSTPLSR